MLFLNLFYCLQCIINLEPKRSMLVYSGTTVRKIVFRYCLTVVVDPGGQICVGIGLVISEIL